MRGSRFMVVEVRGYGRGEVLEAETMEELHDRMSEPPGSNGHATKYKVVEVEGYGKTDLLEAQSYDQLRSLVGTKLGQLP